MTTWLLDREAVTSARDNEASITLHLAAERGGQDMIKLSGSETGSYADML